MPRGLHRSLTRARTVSSPGRVLSIEGLQQWEDEMLEMARENAELKVRSSWLCGCVVPLTVQSGCRRASS